MLMGCGHTGASKPEFVHLLATVERQFGEFLAHFLASMDFVHVAGDFVPDPLEMQYRPFVLFVLLVSLCAFAVCVIF